MKRVTVTLPSMPLLIGLILTLLFGLYVGSFSTRTANGATPNTVGNTPLTGCVANSKANGGSLRLAGRVITPSDIVQLASQSSCGPNETSISWNQISDIQYTSNTSPLPALVAQQFPAYCPSGKQATSGGYTINIPDANLTANIRVTTSAPTSDNSGNYWGVVAENFNDPANPNSTASVTVYAVCQTLASNVHPSAAARTNSPTPNLYNAPIKLNPAQKSNAGKLSSGKEPLE